MVDPKIINGGADAVGDQLKSRGIGCAPHYIRKPAFMCRIFREQKTFGNSGFPLRGSENLSGRAPSMQDFPGAAEALSRLCLLPWNEKYTQDDVDYIAEAIIEAVKQLS